MNDNSPRFPDEISLIFSKIRAESHGEHGLAHVECAGGATIQVPYTSMESATEAPKPDELWSGPQKALTRTEIVPYSPANKL